MHSFINEINFILQLYFFNKNINTNNNNSSTYMIHFFFFLRMTGLLHLSSMKALRQEWWTTSTSTHSREINKSLDSSSIKIPITTSQNKNFLQLDSISESSIYQKTSSTFVLLLTIYLNDRIGETNKKTWSTFYHHLQHKSLIETQ